MNAAFSEDFVQPPLEITTATVIATGGFPSLKIYKLHWDEIVKAIPELATRGRPTSVAEVAELNVHLFGNYRYGHALWRYKGLAAVLFLDKREFAGQVNQRLAALGRFKKRSVPLEELVLKGFEVDPESADLAMYTLFWTKSFPVIKKIFLALPNEHSSRSVVAWVGKRMLAETDKASALDEAGTISDRLTQHSEEAVDLQPVVEEFEKLKAEVRDVIEAVDIASFHERLTSVYTAIRRMGVLSQMVELAGISDLAEEIQEVLIELSGKLAKLLAEGYTDLNADALPTSCPKMSRPDTEAYLHDVKAANAGADAAVAAVEAQQVVDQQYASAKGAERARISASVAVAGGRTMEAVEELIRLLGGLNCERPAAESLEQTPEEDVVVSPSSPAVEPAPASPPVVAESIATPVVTDAAAAPVAADPPPTVPIGPVVSAPVVPAIPPVKIAVGTKLVPSPVEASVEPEAPATPDVEANPRALTAMAQIQVMLRRGYPGLALALARSYADDTGSPLPGAPTVFALLSAATAQVNIVQSGTNQLAQQLSEALAAIKDGADDGAPRAIALSALAAALRPALFDVDAGLSMAVMRELQASGLVGPAVRTLAELVVRRQARGVFEIRPEALVAGYQMSSATVRELQEQYARQAKDVIEEKASRFIRNFSSLPPAVTQYRRYLGPDHAFGQALRALLNTGDPELSLPSIRAALGILGRDRDAMLQADFKAADGPTRLVGAHYERMVSFLEELDGFFRAAQRDLSRLKNAGGSAKLAEFSADLDVRIAAAIREVEDSTVDDDGVLRPLVREATQACLAALRTLIATGKTPTQIAPLDDALNCELALLDIDLGSDIDGDARSPYAIGRETAFAGPADEVLDAIMSFEAAEPPTAQDFLAAAHRHLDQRRLLSARRAIAGASFLMAEKGELAAASHALEQRIAEGRAELVREVANLHTQVDSAAALSLIDDELKSQFDAILDRVGRRANLLPYPGPIENPSASDDPTDLLPAIQYVRTNIAAVLQGRIDRGCEELLLEVERDRQQLPPEAAADIERVRSLVKSQALANAKEFWSLLKSGQPLPEKATGNEMLRDFNTVVLPLFSDPSRKGAVVTETLAALSTGTKRPWLPDLDAERSAAASSMLEAWTKLMIKRTTPSVQAVGRELSQFLQDHLGWTDIVVVSASASEATFRVDGANLAQIAGSDVFTLPCLGSERKASYAVSVLPAQTTVANVRVAMPKADIVFFRGVLTAEQRIDLHQHVRREHHGALIVDDLLITWMAMDRRRIARMIGVGSSFIHSAPYRNAQDMPREMFFGRQRVQQQILNAKEGVLVYGGRRLGKSAVINEICERETRPKQLRYYVKIDVYNIVASEYVDQVWSRMALVLIEHGVLPRTTNTAWSRDRLSKEICDAINKRQLDVTVFIDEADTMMRHDAQQEPRFPLLDQLNQLRKHTSGRFHFAVAGLNNAERVIRYANALMDQFAQPIALTPFVDDERRAGLDLVVKPLGALGFEFQTPDMPYEILSRCIFFPALIQIWCQRLLQVLYEAPHQGLPPYTITRAHMNIVDRDNDLSRGMLKIFQSTLELDPRYRVLAFALAYEQMQSSGTTAVSMTPARLAEKACEYAGQLFPSGAQNNIVEALADELVNLGIFIRTNAGREFQLRSISLLSRLGTREEIETALIEADKAKMERDEGERRVLYSNEKMCPVPLRAIAEWGSPSPGSSPVRVVVASPATGWEDLSLLGHDNGWIGGRAEVGVQRWVAGQTKQVAEAVVKAVEKIGVVTLNGQVHSSRGVTVIPNGWPATLPGALQQRASDIAKASRMVILLADAPQVRTLAELSELPCPLISTGLWGADALHWYAERKDMAWALADDRAVHLLEITGGSPTLLVASMDVIDGGGAVSNWREALAAAGIGASSAEVMNFFGAAPEHHGLMQSLVATTFGAEHFAKAGAGLQKVTNPNVLLACLAALGAVVAVHGNSFITNPVIDEAVLAE